MVVRIIYNVGYSYPAYVAGGLYNFGEGFVYTLVIEPVGAFITLGKLLINEPGLFFSVMGSMVVDYIKKPDKNILNDLGTLFFGDIKDAFEERGGMYGSGATFAFLVDMGLGSHGIAFFTKKITKEVGEKMVKEITEEVSERIVKEASEKFTKEGAEKGVKESSEKVLKETTQDIGGNLVTKNLDDELALLGKGLKKSDLRPRSEVRKFATTSRHRKFINDLYEAENPMEVYKKFVEEARAYQTQIHHILSNKYTKAAEEFTTQFENVLKKYDGLDLDGDWNKIELPHNGSHPREYHKFMIKKVNEIDAIAQGDKDLFLKLFDERIKNQLQAHPEMLNKEEWLFLNATKLNKYE